MGLCKAFYPQVRLNFNSHLKVVWNLMFIMVLLVLSIGLLQNILNLLEDVLDSLNEPGRFVGLSLSMGRIFLGGCKG